MGPNMPMTEDPTANMADFDLLTARQSAVLDLLANGRTTKEIAHSLHLSESAVNRRIELLRTRLGGITRLELARRYRSRAAKNPAHDNGPEAGVETDRQRLQLPVGEHLGDSEARDSLDADLVFQDPIAITIEPPWSKPPEPKIVPGVLDGENALLTRGAAIAIILLGIIASLVLGLAAAQGITDALGK